MAKGFFKNIVLILLGILIATFIAECTLRIIYKAKFAKRPAFYKADPILGWKPESNLNHTFYGSDFKTKIVTDSYGYRLGILGPIDYSKDLILVLGDSYTFGWGVNSDQTFVSFLDEQLDQISNHTIRAVNLGVGGYGTFQYAFRLKEFLDAHPDSRIRAVIINHCSNDMADNLKSLGYHFGFWESTTTPQTKSRIHLVNFLNHLKDLKYSKSKIKETSTTEFHDELWSFTRTTPLKLPKQIQIHSTLIDLQNISAKDFINQKSNITQIQKKLSKEAIYTLHSFLKNKNIPVIHAFVYQTNSFYKKTLTDIIKQTNEFNNRIYILGSVPTTESYSEQISNTHSGGHFTPRFNQFWAESMILKLQENSILSNL